MNAPLKVDDLGIEDRESITHFPTLRGSDGTFYKLCQPIGKGAFGVVHRTVSLQDGTHYAAKHFLHVEERAKLEMKILKSVIHVSKLPQPSRVLFCLNNLTETHRCFQRHRGKS